VNPLAVLHPRADDGPQPPLRILVVDDQLLYAEAISVLLRLHDNIEVVGIAADGGPAGSADAFPPRRYS